MSGKIPFTSLNNWFAWAEAEIAGHAVLPRHKNLEIVIASAAKSLIGTGEAQKVFADNQFPLSGIERAEKFPLFRVEENPEHQQATKAVEDVVVGLIHRIAQDSGKKRVAIGICEEIFSLDVPEPLRLRAAVLHDSLRGREMKIAPLVTTTMQEDIVRLLKSGEPKEPAGYWGKRAYRLLQSLDCAG